jgi:hypothetical protein
VSTPENLAANLIAKNVYYSSKKRTNIVAKFLAIVAKHHHYRGKNTVAGMQMEAQDNAVFRDAVEEE